MKERRHYIWLVLLGVVLLLNIPAGGVPRFKGLFREVMAPFQKAAHSLSERLRQVLSNVDRIDAMSQSTDSIATELFILRDRMRRLDELEAENAELRGVLQFASRSTYKLVACQVIGRGDISGWWQMIHINKGRVDGLRKNHAVIGFSGLVGRTLEVSEHSSDVLLLTDRNCKVAALLPRSRGLGILRGDGASQTGGAPLQMFYAMKPCRMDYVDKNLKIEIGDQVVTSGLGGVYPADVTIGSVVETHDDASGLYQSLDVKPVLELRTLRYVFVVVE